MIDNECKRVNIPIAEVMTKCVLNFVDPSASDSVDKLGFDPTIEITASNSFW